ncbi:MAG: primosomal protein N' [Candidatus Omnitrophica bacterium]|nr:primosomal protein N' [Candidatus Omnitrophota bacterium]
MTRPAYVEVALGLPHPSGTLQYQLPPSAPAVRPGQRVAVTVRDKRMIGYVVSLSDGPAVPGVKPVEEVIDEEPMVSAGLLELTRWMSGRYLCSWGQALEAAMPAPFKKGRTKLKSKGRSAIHGAESEAPDEHPLTAPQRQAYDRIASSINSGRSETFLLHGVTGSGKTEVYLHVIRDLIASGKGSIVLVPEISLTPQAIDRFHSRFGDRLAVMHSRLTPAKRVEEWHRVRAGKALVVVGARSAIFAPVKDLGLVVIDEEQESTYKQDETPRYHARTVAEHRCRLEGAALVLGSATPSLEAYHATETGSAIRLELPERVESRPLPEVRVVDMRLRESAPARGERIYSRVLEEEVRGTLARGEQAMLLLNRRGYATYLHCNSCGHVMTCPNCRVTLTFHADKSSLYCHLCHHRAVPEKVCPKCKLHNLHYFGAGTQKVEAETARLFPQARIGRMDSDSTARKDAHETILRAFKRREIDLLIGTQMIAKGHDFPHVSLIGVISADTALHLPDFRASERTFDLLTQAAGRAGRGSIPGRVIVQTHVPMHYSVQAAKDHDYREFYDREIEVRRELAVPPFSCLARVVFSASTERDAMRQGLELARSLELTQTEGRYRLLGPAPCPNVLQEGKHQWNLYLKAEDWEPMLTVLQTATAGLKKIRGGIVVDVDPQ